MTRIIALLFLVGCNSMEGSATQNLTENPCTSVSLVAPVSGFTASVGTPVLLSATARCPAGQTPEFEYWGKHKTDANWTILTSYVPSGASHTPIATDVGDYCFSAVVRAAGSTDVYQARSSGVCGTVTSGASQTSSSTTIAIPLYGFVNNSVSPAQFLTTNGAQGVIVQMPSIPVGAALMEVKFRVRDNAIGPTMLYAALADQWDMNIVGIGSLTSDTDGSGTFQTLDIRDPLGFPLGHIESMHTYSAGVFVDVGTAPCIVTSIEVTYK